MPATARLVDRAKLEGLIANAERTGFSRTAKGITPDESRHYIVMPYLLESNPAPVWICMVIGVPAALVIDVAERPHLSFARLDISLRDFRKLRRLRRWESDQLLHWLSWEASKGKM